MKNNTMRNLVIIAMALSGLAWFASQRQAADYGSPELGVFAPELESRLADITRVEIHAAGEEPFVIEQTGDATWVLPAKAGYPVDNSQLRKTLRVLATTKVVEAKTANPEWHARLKLSPVIDAADTTVELRALAGDEPVMAVLLGSTGQGGMYVRRVEQNQTWLIDQTIQPGRNATAWLDKELLDIKRADLASVEVTPVDGESWSLRHDPETSDFELAPSIPSGRESNGANINRLLAALSTLRLLDVRSPVAEDDAAAWQVVRFTGKDGVQVTVEVRQDGSNYLLRLHADAVTDAEDFAAAQATAQDLETRIRGRIFSVSSYVGIGLLQSYEKMLKDPPAPADA